MHIGKNIKKYHKQNHITQEELAQKLALTRQSISKWENGETLSSIDNLIVLSNLLDVSLDELITGEAYLHFPFEYGTIKHRKTLYTFLFSPTILAILTAWNAFLDFSQNSTYLIMALFLQLLLCLLFIYVFSLKKSRLYTHWTLTKKAIVVPIYKLNSWTELWLPIKELVHRETKTIPITDIDHIRLSIDPFPLDPNLGKSLYGGYFARNISVMSEPFF
ncbi:helix-turn-helix domain-containing protein [Enterococcus bulliens]